MWGHYLGLRRWPKVPVVIGSGCTIDRTSRLGVVRESAVNDLATRQLASPVMLGANGTIGCYVVVHDSTLLDDSCFVDDHVRLGYSVYIGSRTRVEYGAFVCDRVQIGSDCVVAGFICDGVTIGNNVVTMASYVHKLAEPRRPWGVVEPAASVEDGTVVGYGATVVGGVTIGSGSYIAAGSIVTKDVPADSVVTGVNNVVPVEKWHGRELVI